MSELAIADTRATAAAPSQMPGFLKDWFESRRPTIELERSIVLIDPEKQVRPLMIVGPVDLRVGAKLNVKGALIKGGSKDKIAIKKGAIGFEHDVAVAKNMFQIKEVKLTSEMKSSSGNKPGEHFCFAKIIGVELTFDTTALLRRLRTTALAGYEPEKTIWDCYSRALKKNEEKDIELEFKTEFSVNIDLDHLLMDPQRVLTFELGFKHQELTLGGLFESLLTRFRPQLSIPEDHFSKQIVIEPEGQVICNLNSAGWASLIGAAGWGGSRHLAWEVLERSRAFMRAAPRLLSRAVLNAPRAILSSQAVAVAGGIAGAAASAAFGRIAIGHALLTGRNMAIGYKFAQGYARALSQVIDAQAEKLAAKIQRFAEYDWRGNLEELARMVHITRGETAFVAAQALELIPITGQAALMQELGAFLAKAASPIELWANIQHVHLGRTGQTESERYHFYLSRLYAQLHDDPQFEQLGIPLLAP